MFLASARDVSSSEGLSVTVVVMDVLLGTDRQAQTVCVEFLRALGSQSGMNVWQHTLVG